MRHIDLKKIDVPLERGSADGQIVRWNNTTKQWEPVTGVSIDGSGNLILPGSVSAGLPRVVKAVTGSLTAQECRGTLVTNKGQTLDATITLPALAEGLCFTYLAETTVAAYYRFDPNGSEVIRLDGVELTGGYYVGVASAEAGQKLSFTAAYNSAGSLIWDAVSAGPWTAQA